MHAEWLALLPLISLAAGGTLIFCLGAFISHRRPAPLLAIAILACLASGGTAICPPEGGSRAISALLANDGFSALYYALFAAITLITLLFSYQYAKERGFAGDEFFGITLFATMGMGVIAAASHWLIFFLGLELLSISLYVLIAIRRGEALGLEAGVKYFIMGAVASAFVAFGIAMLYGATGSLEISSTLDLTAHPDNRLILLWGLSLILAGLGFKISLVPFHLWTPDVYQGAPAPVTAFLATGSKVAVLALFIRLAVYGGEGVGALLLPLLWGLAALTMVIGNITTLAQTQLKRLLAYSSMAHMGYALMALLAIGEQGAAAVIFFSVVYAAMDLGAFGTVGLLSSRATDRDAIADYQGLGYSHPGKAALLTLTLFSLAGLPATAGFIAKFVIFRAALEANVIGLAMIGILTAIVSLYAYLKVVVVLYMRPVATPLIAEKGSEGLAATASLLVAAALLSLGLMPSFLLDLIRAITEQAFLK